MSLLILFGGAGTQVPFVAQIYTASLLANPLPGTDLEVSLSPVASLAVSLTPTADLQANMTPSKDLETNPSPAEEVYSG